MICVGLSLVQWNKVKVFIRVLEKHSLYFVLLRLHVHVTLSDLCRVIALLNESQADQIYFGFEKPYDVRNVFCVHQAKRMCNIAFFSSVSC